MRLLFLCFLAVVVAACSGDDLEEDRQATLAFIDSVEWPEGYEPREVLATEPSTAFVQGRSGAFQVHFDDRGEAEEDVMIAFHEAFVRSGFVLDVDSANRCTDGRIQLRYSHEAAGGSIFNYQVFGSGNVSLSTTLGWGVRQGDDLLEVPPSDAELPVCEG